MGLHRKDHIEVDGDVVEVAEADPPPQWEKRQYPEYKARRGPSSSPEHPSRANVLILP